MKARTKLVLVVVGLVILAVIASVPIWIDGAACSALESEAEAALGVETKLERVDISLFGGEAGLVDLEIANPKGFEYSHIFKLRHGLVSVSLGTLMEDKVVVPELVLDGVDVRLENIRGRSNYGVILDRLAKLETEKPDEEGKKFVIERVIVRNITVKAKVSLTGLARPAVTMRIPELRFNNLGSDGDNGAALRKIVGEITAGLLAGVMTFGGDLLPPEISQGLATGLKGVGSLTRIGVEVFGEGGKLLGSVGGKVGDGVGKVLEGVGGLLGGDKKQDGKKDDED